LASPSLIMCPVAVRRSGAGASIGQSALVPKFTRPPVVEGVSVTVFIIVVASVVHVFVVDSLVTRPYWKVLSRSVGSAACLACLLASHWLVVRLSLRINDIGHR